MDTIKDYLNNMFLQLQETEDVKKAKAEMLSMMEDKYQELKAEGKSENEAIGIVISEFGSIEEVIRELGLDSQGNKCTKPGTSNVGTDSTEKPLRRVSKATAQEFIDVSVATSKYIALGVFLCVCSPILLIILGGFSDGAYGISENTASLIGLMALFIMVAIAVFLFIIFGGKASRFDYLKKEPFELERSAVNELAIAKEKERPLSNVFIAAGVVLCIVSPIPVICTGLMKIAEIYSIVATGVLLLLVAFAVVLFIVGCCRISCYKVLLQEEEYDVKIKKDKTMDTIAGIYWPLVTAAYLAWSFISMDWQITWVVWPVAGILFGAVSTIVAAAKRV